MACRRAFPVAGGALVRLAAGPDGSVAVGRRLVGRGAWLCAGDRRCHDRALRPKVLSRALRTDISAEAAEQLRSGFPAVVADARD